MGEHLNHSVSCCPGCRDRILTLEAWVKTFEAHQAQTDRWVAEVVEVLKQLSWARIPNDNGG